MAVGTTLVMMSARPARVRELIRNDGRRDRHALVDHFNQVIMKKVLCQQHGSPASCCRVRRAPMCVLVYGALR